MGKDFLTQARSQHQEYFDQKTGDFGCMPFRIRCLILAQKMPSFAKCRFCEAGDAERLTIWRIWRSAEFHRSAQKERGHNIVPTLNESAEDFQVIEVDDVVPTVPVRR